MTGRLVIVGDTLLDRDIDGTVRRVCPDAPAPVLDEESVRDRPGGAGLAALLAAAQGHDVALVTALADDAGGARLCELLAAAGVEIYALALPGSTPEKVRMRSGGQVLVRLDRGGTDPAPPGDAPDGVLAPLHTAATILVSDYGRGMARHPAVRAALSQAGAPVVWDPHPRGPAPVAGVRLATPNAAEVRELTGDGGGGSRLAAAARGGHELRRRWRAGAVVVTMGADGAVLCQSGPTPLVVPVPAVAGGDTCGAGDRFAVSAAAALAAGALVSEAVRQAVVEAAHYVAAGGATTVPAGSSPVNRAGAAPDGGVRPGPHHADSAAVHNGSAGPDRPDARQRRLPARNRPTADQSGRRRFTAWRPDHEPSGDRVGAEAAGRLMARIRADGGTVVATGGCFDLLHAGHLATLRAAWELGDCLIVCLNSDASVARLKGPDRPLTNQADRSRLLAALRYVDAVVVFDEPTPESVLSWLRPDIWVKGGDYTDGGPDLPEAELISRWGGQTVVVPYLNGRSTTRTIAAARANGSARHQPEGAQ